MSFETCEEAIFNCPRQGRCGLRGAAHDAESALGQPDAHVVFLGSSPGELQTKDNPFQYESDLGRRRVQLRERTLPAVTGYSRWNRYKTILDTLNRTCGTHFTFADNSVLVLNVAKCFAPREKVFGGDLPDRPSRVPVFYTAYPCAALTREMLDHRPRIVISHGRVAWAWIGHELLGAEGKPWPELAEAVVSHRVCETSGH